MDARSAELLEFPLVRVRLAAYAAFAPSRRLALAARALGRPGRRDAAARRDRRGPLAPLGAARHRHRRRAGHRRPSCRGPSAAAASTRASCGPSRRRSWRPAAWPTRCASVERPLLHDLYREPRRPAGAARPTGGQRRSGRRDPRHGLAGARRPAPRRCASPTSDCAPGSSRSSTPSSRAPSRSPSSRCATGATSCPVRADAKGQVRGIVHDQSGSGQTLFVEPLVAVELSQRLARGAADGPGRGGARPRRALRATWRASADALGADLDALARFDLWLCRARLAEELDAIRPRQRRRRVRSRCSRHAIPGLTGRVVPIDVRLGDEYTALVITGPNTGGKTVALRTVGLLVLMHQSGLHVPAATGSALPIFRDVFADIGDEQSVAQSLSTFSGHLRTIVRIVEAAGAGMPRAARRAGRGHRPDRGLGARPGAARPLHPRRARSSWPRRTTPSSRRTPTTSRVPATPRSSSTSRRWRRPTASPSACRAPARRSPSPSAWGCRRRSSRTHARGSSVAQQEFESTLASIRGRQQDIDGRPRRAPPMPSSGPGWPSPRPRRSDAAPAPSGAWPPRRPAGRPRWRWRPSRPRSPRCAAPWRARRSPSRASTRPWRASSARLAAHARGRGPADERAARRAGGWQVGDRAATASGWVGTIAALDEARGRATLEVGGMRVEVPSTSWSAATRGRPRRLARRGRAATAVPAAPAHRPARRLRRASPTRQASRRHPPRADRGRRRGRARPRSRRRRASTSAARAWRRPSTCSSSTSTTRRMADAGRVTVIHGHGSGAMRDAVRTCAEQPPARPRLAPRRTRRGRRRRDHRLALDAEDGRVRPRRRLRPPAAASVDSAAASAAGSAVGRHGGRRSAAVGWAAGGAVGSARSAPGRSGSGSARRGLRVGSGVGLRRGSVGSAAAREAASARGTCRRDGDRGTRCRRLGAGAGRRCGTARSGRRERRRPSVCP